MSTSAQVAAPRVVDATLTTILLIPGRALDRHVLAALWDAFPVPSTSTAVPILPDGAYGADLLWPPPRWGSVLEPLTWQARARLQNENGLGACIVADPDGVPLGAQPPEAPPLPDSALREAVAWLRPAMTIPDVVTALDQTLSHLAPRERLRLRDPHGVIDAETTHALAGHRAAARLTLVPENARGLADAVAHIALATRDGPLVRTSLFGLGPRTGSAATELAVAPSDAERVRPVAERVALLLERPIHARHPLWGTARRDAVEPDLVRPSPAAEGEWEPVPNVATLDAVVDTYLADWGLQLDTQERTNVLETLRANLRPGDALDGPRMWAIVAGLVDLRSRLLRGPPADEED